MFCPKCGGEVIEGQKFCKMCGTNMQLVTDAINHSDDTLKQFGIDVEALKRNASEFVKNMKVGVIHMSGPVGKEGREHHSEHWRANRDSRNKDREKDKNLPKPKDWMPYSWQHNLKNGLISLFSGVGLGILFYYLGRVAINAGTIQDIETAVGHNIRGIEQIISLLWLVALIPVLKGGAQIIYAAFFGQSLTKLAEKFIPQPQPEIDRTTAGFALGEPPPSVTENTTQFFEETHARPGRESQ